MITTSPHVYMFEATSRHTYISTTGDYHLSLAARQRAVDFGRGKVKSIANSDLSLLVLGAWGCWVEDVHLIHPRHVHARQLAVHRQIIFPRRQSRCGVTLHTFLFFVLLKMI